MDQNTLNRKLNLIVRIKHHSTKEGLESNACGGEAVKIGWIAEMNGFIQLAWEA